jgi:mannose-6-phosphate isomerase-like protein (cupin superfamily)
MIRAGQTVVNPVTGERLLFELTANETDGELTRIQATVEPGGFVASSHLHPRQSERFEVLEGSLMLVRGHEQLELHEGDAVLVPPGTPHRFWNASDAPVRFRTDIRPSLRIESLIETMFGLAAAGRTNARGMPNLFRLAVVARHHFDTVRLPLVPQALQRAALIPGSWFGRALGYVPTCDQAAGRPALA